MYHLKFCFVYTIFIHKRCLKLVKNIYFNIFLGKHSIFKRKLKVIIFEHIKHETNKERKYVVLAFNNIIQGRNNENFSSDIDL